MIELQFQYRSLFNIILKNNYFDDKNLRNFVIVPTNETQQLINHLGFIYKQNDSGFVVLADIQHPDHSSLVFEGYLGKNIKLDFLIYIQDPIFRNYTNLPYNNSDQIFLFTNRNLQASDKVNLHKAEFVSDQDLIELAEINKNDKRSAGSRNIKGSPFGRIELLFNDEILEKILDGLIDNEIPEFKYEINFDSRSTIWKYIIIPNYSRKLKELRISMLEGDTVRFSSPQSIEINEKEALMIQTEEPVKYQEFYDFSFQLKRGSGGNGGKTVIKKMQYAPIDRIVPVDKNNKENYIAEIYVYI
jgi:hypothetical protein